MTNQEEFDVAVIGAGPAGSSAAIRLAKGGMKVALIEKDQFPRHKVCGEFISPECLPHLDEVGVLDLVSSAGPAQVSGTRFYARNGHSAEIPSKWFAGKGQSLSLSRAALDNCLLVRARELGVNVLDPTGLSGLTMADHGVTLNLRRPDLDSGQILAKLVIDATGRQQVVARLIDPQARPRKASSVAFKAHFAGVRIGGGSCEMFVYRGGYGGCSQIEDGLFNLCFVIDASKAKAMGSDGDRILREAVFENARAMEVLGSAERITKWYSVPMAGLGKRECLPSLRVLAIGDAAGFIDPFTGSGILLALESSAIAANAILANAKGGDDLAELGRDYRAKFARAFDRRFRLAAFLRHAARHPLAAELLIRCLGFSEPASRKLAQSTRMKVDGVR